MLKVKKVDNLFVSFNCDFKTIRFEHFADFLLFVSVSFEVAWNRNVNPTATLAKNVIFVFMKNSSTFVKKSCVA